MGTLIGKRDLFPHGGGVRYGDRRILLRNRSHPGIPVQQHERRAAYLQVRVNVIRIVRLLISLTVTVR